MSLINNVTDYISGGGALYAGFEPVTPLMNGMPAAQYYQFGAGNVVARKGPFGVGTVSQYGLEAGGMTSKLMLGGNLVFSASSLVAGYHLNGMKGVWDAAVWDLAVNSAVNKFGYRRSVDAAGVVQINPARKIINSVFGNWGGAANAGLDFARMGVANIGGGLGAAAGQRILGTPGAFIGGYVGAGIAVNPGAIAAAGILAAPLISAGTGMYAAYKIGQMGVSRMEQRRRIDTAGNTAAFMTQNANTMRARAISAIAKSQVNARSAIGMEAGFMHTNKNYFSVYR